MSIRWKRRCRVMPCLALTGNKRVWESTCGRYRVVMIQPELSEAWRTKAGERRMRQMAATFYAEGRCEIEGRVVWDLIFPRHRTKDAAMKACDNHAAKAARCAAKAG